MLDVDCSPDKLKKNAGDGIVNTEISDDSGIDSKAISDHTEGDVLATAAVIEIKDDIVKDKPETQKKVLESHL